MSEQQVQKRREALIQKYGSEEAYRAKLKEWGRKGGKNATNGFDKQTPERLREISKMGNLAHEKAILRKYGIDWAMPDKQ